MAAQRFRDRGKRPMPAQAADPDAEEAQVARGPEGGDPEDEEDSGDQGGGDPAADEDPAAGSGDDPGGDDDATPDGGGDDGTGAGGAADPASAGPDITGGDGSGDPNAPAGDDSIGDNTGYDDEGNAERSKRPSFRERIGKGMAVKPGAPAVPGPENDDQGMTVFSTEEFMKGMTVIVQDAVNNALSDNDAIADMIQKAIDDNLSEEALGGRLEKAVASQVKTQVVPLIKGINLRIEEFGDHYDETREPFEKAISQISKGMTEIRPLIKGFDVGGGGAPAPKTAPSPAPNGGSRRTGNEGPINKATDIPNPNAPAEPISYPELQAIIAKGEDLQMRTGKPVENLSNATILLSKGGLTQEMAVTLRKSVEEFAAAHPE